MKRKKLFIITGILLSIILAGVIYTFFVQRWVEPVKINTEDIKYFSTFSTLDASNLDLLFEMLYDENGGKENYDNSGFCRTVDFRDKDEICITYNFLDESGSSIDQRVYVYIYTTKTAEYISNTYAWHPHASITDFKKILAREIGLFRPIYKTQTIEGEVENIKYYISPITTSDRSEYICFSPYNTFGKMANSVFEVGGYIINISEYIAGKDESKYSEAFSDLGKFIENAVTT